MLLIWHEQILLKLSLLFLFSIFVATSEQDKELFDLLILPVSPDAHNAVYWKIGLVVIAIINAGVATLTLLFYSMTCYVMYKVSNYFAIKDKVRFNVDILIFVFVTIVLDFSHRIPLQK